MTARKRALAWAADRELMGVSGMTRLLVVGVAVSLSSLARAQQADQGKDTSGTNPTVLSRTLNVTNEHKRLSNGRYANTLTTKFTEPFADGRMSIRFNVPYAMSNVTGRTIDGLGDMSAKLTWLAYLDRRQGLVVSTEVFGPSAMDRTLGMGRWVAAPGATYAYFLTPEVILAPALVHNVSSGGNTARADVNRTDFDFYAVYRPKGQNWWLTSDVTISRDFVARTTPMSWKLALGSGLAKLDNGAALNLSIRPGVGFGPDRPFRWSIEVGLSLVGF